MKPLEPKVGEKSKHMTEAGSGEGWTGGRRAESAALQKPQEGWEPMGTAIMTAVGKMSSWKLVVFLLPDSFR